MALKFYVGCELATGDGISFLLPGGGWPYPPSSAKTQIPITSNRGGRLAVDYKDAFKGLTFGGSAFWRGEVERSVLGDSPMRIVPVMVLSIFFAEFIVMLILPDLGEVEVHLGALIDATLLILLLSPTFYFFHYRPLQTQYRARRETLGKLLASEERLAATLEAVDDGLWDWDIPSGAVYFSPRSQAIIGYYSGELHPHIDTWKDRIHPKDREAVMAALDSHLSGKTEHWETEHRLRTKGKDWVWVLVRGRVVVRGAVGEPLRAVGTVTDITPRKAAEEALRRRKADIRHLSHQLMQTSEAEKKSLARDLHDEFGQVLTAFQLGVELLRESGSGDREALRSQCDRLLAIVSRLRVDIRRICDNLMPTMLDDLGLVATLEWMVREFAAQKPQIQIELEAGFLPREPAGAGAISLYRICQEALNNIAKHAGARRVQVRLAAKQGRLELEVEDDGLGFAPEALDPSTSGRWGIGLVGMRERAMAVGGEVRVKSQPGQGTRVCAWLPLADGEES